MNFSYPQIVLQEIPGYITLAISISGCSLKCKGCHSSFTWDKKYGEELTIEKIDYYILKNKYIDCFLFYGGEWNQEELIYFIKYIKEKYKIKVALFSGLNYKIDNIDDCIDIYKIGEYIKELGGLGSINTNQKIFYK